MVVRGVGCVLLDCFVATLLAMTGGVCRAAGAGKDNFYFSLKLFTKFHGTVIILIYFSDIILFGVNKRYGYDKEIRWTDIILICARD